MDGGWKKYNGENDMRRTKIAFAGGRMLGAKTLKWLCEQEYFDVIAVCLIPSEFDADYHKILLEYVNKHKLNVCDISELKNMEIDIGLSVNFHKIICPEILDHCKKGFYNVHHSYNLRLRGRNITTHAILNTLSEEIFYHGTTLHKMVAELDAGPIVASHAIGIEKEDTAYSLFCKADKAALSLIKEWLPRIAFQDIFPYQPPVDGIHMYKAADMPKRILYTDYMDSKTINTYIRAFDFKGNEPAYIQLEGKKLHLVFYPRDQYQYGYQIKGHMYYSAENAIDGI